MMNHSPHTFRTLRLDAILADTTTIRLPALRELDRELDLIAPTRADLHNIALLAAIARP